MFVFFDASPSLQPLAGVGRYTLGLLRGLLEEWPAHWPAPAVWLNSLRRSPCPVRHAFLLEAAAAGRARLVRTRWPGPVLLQCWRWAGAPAAEFFSPAAQLVHGVGTYLIPARRAARVATLHDLWALRAPEQTHSLGGRYLARALPGRIEQVEAVIVPSGAAEREAREHFPRIAPGRIHVIAEGVSAPPFAPQPPGRVEECLRRRGIAAPYALVVATLEPRKNLATLFRAFAAAFEARKDDIGAPLLIRVGRPGWGGVTPEGLAREAGLPPARYRWFSDVDDEDLAALYTGAVVTVAPALWEGFGLTVLEAMACGCPVIASRGGALPEVAGEAAAALFAPHDTAALARALAELFAAAPGARRELSEASLRRAARFTWQAAARETLNVYREAASRAKSRAK